MKAIEFSSLKHIYEERELLYHQTYLPNTNHPFGFVVILSAPAGNQVSKFGSLLAFSSILQAIDPNAIIVDPRAHLLDIIETTHQTLAEFYEVNKIGQPIQISVFIAVIATDKIYHWNSGDHYLSILKNGEVHEIDTQKFDGRIFGFDEELEIKIREKRLQPSDLVVVSTSKITDILKSLEAKTIDAIKGKLNQTEQNVLVVAAKINKTEHKMAAPYPKETAQKTSLSEPPKKRPSWKMPRFDYRKPVSQIRKYGAYIILAVFLLVLVWFLGKWLSDGIPPESDRPPIAATSDSLPPQTTQEPETTEEPTQTTPDITSYQPGDLIWKYNAGKMISSSPVTWNDNVYFGCKDNNFYALDSKNGKMLWKYETGAGIGSSPIIADNKVIFGSYDGNVYALNPKNGELIWKFGTGKKIVASPVADDECVYIGSYDRNFYAIFLKTGEKKWAFRTKNGIWANGAVDEDFAYVASLDGNLYAVNLADGAREWTFNIGDEIYSSPVVDEKHVYIGSRNKLVYAVNKDIGRIFWKFNTGEKVYSSPVISDDILYISANNGTLYAVNTEDGKEKWQYSIGKIADLRGTPSIEDDTIYFSGYDRKVHAVTLRNGKGEWTFSAGSPIYSSPCVNEGMVYVGSNGGVFYAIAAEHLKIKE